ncbi:unnamed protein product [Caenorhabditis angaria]|uniref:Uncharacterized protein n=1 Tax=Caenorhabditis angaria TaxID=860376 RepID=A0A9P1J4B6_9PELO|nr:unnamed protein product [Caenorhabditis angaria]
MNNENFSIDKLIRTTTNPSSSVDNSVSTFSETQSKSTCQNIESTGTYRLRVGKNHILVFPLFDHFVHTSKTLTITDLFGATKNKTKIEADSIGEVTTIHDGLHTDGSLLSSNCKSKNTDMDKFTPAPAPGELIDGRISNKPLIYVNGEDYKVQSNATTNYCAVSNEPGLDLRPQTDACSFSGFASREKVWNEDELTYHLKNFNQRRHPVGNKEWLKEFEHIEHLFPDAVGKTVMKVDNGY